MSELAWVAAIVTLVIVVLFAGFSVLFHVIVARTRDARLWNAAAAFLSVAVVARVLLLFDPSSLWALPVANACTLLTVGSVWLGARVINGQPIRRGLIAVAAVSVAAAAATAATAAYERGTPTPILATALSISIALLVALLLVASALSCRRGELVKIPASRVLAACLIISAVAIPLGAPTYFAFGLVPRPTPNLDTGGLPDFIYSVLSLALLPISGIAMLSIATALRRIERAASSPANPQVFLGARAFQVAVAESAEMGEGLHSLAVVNVPPTGDEELWATTAAVAEALGPQTVVGAFTPGSIIVVSNHDPDLVGERIREVLSAGHGKTLKVTTIDYSDALLAEIIRDSSPDAGSRARP